MDEKIRVAITIDLASGRFANRAAALAEWRRLGVA
jgi:hypothetical protein